MARRRVWVQVAAVTVVTALLLGGTVTALLEASAETARGPSAVLRQWALWSALSLPVAFVFGGVAFAIGRSVWRGRRQR